MEGLNLFARMRKLEQNIQAFVEATQRWQVALQARQDETARNIARWTDASQDCQRSDADAVRNIERHLGDIAHSLRVLTHRPEPE